MTTIAQELRQEGKEIGFDEGLGEGVRNSVVTTLQVRFGEIPQHVMGQLQETSGVEALNYLLTQALTAVDLADFERRLSG